MISERVLKVWIVLGRQWLQRDFIPIVTSGRSKTGDSFLWLQPWRLPLVGWSGALLPLELSSSRVNGQWWGEWRGWPDWCWARVRSWQVRTRHYRGAKTRIIPGQCRDWDHRIIDRFQEQDPDTRSTRKYEDPRSYQDHTRNHQLVNVFFLFCHWLQSQWIIRRFDIPGCQLW